MVVKTACWMAPSPRRCGARGSPTGRRRGWCSGGLCGLAPLHRRHTPRARRGGERQPAGRARRPLRRDRSTAGARAKPWRRGAAAVPLARARGASSRRRRSRRRAPPAPAAESRRARARRRCAGGAGSRARCSTGGAGRFVGAVAFNVACGGAAPANAVGVSTHAGEVAFLYLPSLLGSALFVFSPYVYVVEETVAGRPKSRRGAGCAGPRRGTPSSRSTAGLAPLPRRLRRLRAGRAVRALRGRAVWLLRNGRFPSGASASPTASPRSASSAAPPPVSFPELRSRYIGYEENFRARGNREV